MVAIILAGSKSQTESLHFRKGRRRWLRNTNPCVARLPWRWVRSPQSTISTIPTIPPASTSHKPAVPLLFCHARGTQDRRSYFGQFFFAGTRRQWRDLPRRYRQRKCFRDYAGTFVSLLQSLQSLSCLNESRRRTLCQGAHGGVIH